MNAEFHYYAIYVIAREAGLEEGFAYRMAQASQYVDASLSPLRFDTPRGTVDVAVTQNYVFWDDAIRRDVYLPFHFLPGDPEAAARARIDGEGSPYAVTPNGDLAKKLLEAAFRDKDPYLMGIALHSFADTWAHQNFSGREEAWNDMGGRSAAMGLPPVGHLHAFAWPDEPDRTWTDPRLVPELASVVNRERFYLAARKIFRYLRVFQGKKFDDEELALDGLRAVWASPSRDERLADYTIRWGVMPWNAQDYRIRAGAPEDRSPLSGIRHYDKLTWAKGELLRALSPGGPQPAIAVGSGFFESDLFRWHEAAREHRARAQAALGERKL